MSKNAIQRYLEIREKKWAVRDRPWADDEFKERCRDIAIVRQELSICITGLLKLGRAENIDACFLLGDAYVAGNGVTFDRVKAIKWFRKAAEQGHIHAMVRLATALMHPDSAATAVEGIEWLHRAANKGEPGAMVRLGFAYRDAHGVAHDLQKAEYWFTRAYEAGDLHCMAYLGRIHALKTKSPGKALPWLRKAADAGFTDSYWALATLCGDPTSLFYSPTEAVHWLKAIANTIKPSAPRALVHLARMARDGHGIAQDLGLARTYVETALTLDTTRDVRREAERLLADLNSSFL